MNFFVRWVVTLAALVSTGYAEFSLAHHLGWNTYIACTLPLVLDLYLVHAVRQRKDVAPAVTAVILVSATSYVVAHPVDKLTPVRIAVSAIAPIILWRIEATMRHDVTSAAEWRKHKIWDVPRTAVTTPVDTAPLVPVTPDVPEQPPVTPPAEPKAKKGPRWPNPLSDAEARHVALAAYTHHVTPRDAEDDVTRSHTTIYRWYKQWESEGVKRMAMAA